MTDASKNPTYAEAVAGLEAGRAASAEHRLSEVLFNSALKEAKAQRLIAELRRGMWLLVKAAGGKITVDRHIAENFNPEKADLHEWFDADKQEWTVEALEGAPVTVTTPDGQEHQGVMRWRRPTDPPPFPSYIDPRK